MDLISLAGSAPPAAVLAAAMIAGLVRGYTGFGSAMVFMPVASAAFVPQVAIAVMFITDNVMQVILLRSSLKHARWGEFGPLLAGYSLGFPAGLYALVTVDQAAMRWAISAMILTGLVLIVSGLRIRTAPGLAATVATGTASGIASGSASLGGMVLSLFWLSGPAANEAVRGSSIGFFLFASLISGTLIALAGLFTAEAFRLALWMLAPYGLGMALGNLLFGRADPRLFRPVAFGIIAIAAMTSLPLFDRLIRG